VGIIVKLTVSFNTQAPLLAVKTYVDVTGIPLALFNVIVVLGDAGLVTPFVGDHE